MDYVSYFDLDIEHPFLSYSSWQVLPGHTAERALALQRVRQRFGAVPPTPASGQLPDHAGIPPIARLSFIGEEDRHGGLGLNPLSADIKSMEFYLFCRDPYFYRMTNVQLMRPGRKLLHFDFRPACLPQAEAASGTSGPKCAAQADVVQLEAAAAKVIPFDEPLESDVSRSRKKYHGTPFGPPPVALISLPFVGRAFPARFRLHFAPREMRWTYEIIPRPESDLLIEGGPCEFQSESMIDVNSNILRLVSDSKIPLGISLRPQLRLLIKGEDGSCTPLVENLPIPAAANVGWNKVLNDYEAIVWLDLKRLGLSF
ncbi:hypothetical protein LJC48_05935 [Desulfovibrio sp. OttesenSCG-928-C06]|nr:hypothetical protein [Desulfovibrio sp. OttesenSCG-928-C06]